MAIECQRKSERVLVVGRSPSVLEDAVELLRGRGYYADATNQFENVPDDYDLSEVDVLVFGGMVPPDTKQFLGEAVTLRNPDVTIVQGLAGIAGVIAAQVQAVTSSLPEGLDVSYDPSRRAVLATLTFPARLTVEAWWATSFTPPEPTSTSRPIFEADLDPGSYVVPLPALVPDQASFATVTVANHTEVFMVGAMPENVLRMVHKSATDKRLPDVRAVTTHHDDA
jgi:hypothetical protein